MTITDTPPLPDSPSPARRPGFLRRWWKVLVPVGVIGGAIAAYLALVVFCVQCLFIDDVVNEAGPVFDSGAGAAAAIVDVEEGMDAPDDMPAELDEVMEDAADDATPTPAPPVEAAAEPEIVTLASGDFIDHSHPTSGTAVVLNDGSAQRFLRFEDDFRTDNGPDLDVYLVRGADAADRSIGDDYINLGDLKGNIGSQNYEIPEDVDLSEYDTVVIWCVRFSVGFGAADLT